MKRLFPKGISLSSLITIIILLCMLAPSIFTSVYFGNQLKSNIYTSLEKDLKLSAEKSFSALDSKFLDIKNTYYNIMSDPIMNADLYENMSQLNLLQSDNSTLIEDRLHTLMFYNTLWSEQLLTAIVFYRDNDTCVHIAQDYGNISQIRSGQNALSCFYQKWDKYKAAFPSNKRINEFTASFTVPDTLYYIRDYYNYLHGTFEGIITLQLKESALLECFNDFSKYENTLCFLSDKSGNILIDSTGTLKNKNLSESYLNDQTLRQLMNDQENYMLISDSLLYVPYDVSILIPLKPIQTMLISQLYNYLYIFLILLALILIVAILISRFINNYTLTLIRQMATVSEGNYIQTLPSYGITEIDNLSNAFCDMAQQISKLLNEIYANEVLLKESELKALQAQINPHFLFNTLLSISWRARALGDNETYDLLTALSTLLNASIFTEKKCFITIQEELQNVKAYLFIQTSRFGDRMSYDIDVEQKILQHPVLKLSLQPIVENAIVHGLESKAGTGYVLIEGFLEEEYIILRVTDNGVGFDTQKLNAVFSEEEHPEDVKGHHIGLLNTHMRIRYTYGDPFGLEIRSAPGRGTSVTIRYPYKEDYNVSNPDC